ncbi:MAG: hypothetical protein PHO67_05390 [Candidatus Omnitrophica bacterium]|nr:hypothetical protein [Candidatus Omnitrophota bacterium]
MKQLKAILPPLGIYFITVLIIASIWGFNAEAAKVLIFFTFVPIIVGLPLYIVIKTFTKTYILTILIPVLLIVTISLIQGMIKNELARCLTWLPLAVFFMFIGFPIISLPLLMLIRNVLTLLHFRNQQYR